METAERIEDYALVAAVVLTVMHLFSHQIRRVLHPYAEAVASFGGGLAVAYVFLQVFPEIELAHEWLGDTVHVITLLSFLFFYAIEIWFLQQRRAEGHGQNAGHENRRVFWFHIGLIWIYTSMAVFALPEDLSDDFFFAFVGSLAIGLHLIYKDYVLHSHHGDLFERLGRWPLVLAPLAGFLARVIWRPPDVIFDVFVAILAGFLIQSVFREELPRQEHARLGWLFGGVATYWLLLTLIG